MIYLLRATIAGISLPQGVRLAAAKAAYGAAGILAEATVMYRLGGVFAVAWGLMSALVLSQTRKPGRL